MTALRLWN